MESRLVGYNVYLPKGTKSQNKYYVKLEETAIFTINFHQFSKAVITKTCKLGVLMVACYWLSAGHKQELS